MVFFLFPRFCCCLRPSFSLNPARCEQHAPSSNAQGEKKHETQNRKSNCGHLPKPETCFRFPREQIRIGTNGKKTEFRKSKCGHDSSRQSQKWTSAKQNGIRTKNPEFRIISEFQKRKNGSIFVKLRLTLQRPQVLETLHKDSGGRVRRLRPKFCCDPLVLIFALLFYVSRFFENSANPHFANRLIAPPNILGGK